MKDWQCFATFMMEITKNYTNVLWEKLTDL